MREKKQGWKSRKESVKKRGGQIAITHDREMKSGLRGDH